MTTPMIGGDVRSYGKQFKNLSPLFKFLLVVVVLFFAGLILIGMVMK